MNLRATLERFTRDRRRLTPRVLRVIYFGDGSQLVVNFKDKMDTQQNMAVVRLCVPSLGVVEFTDFSWTSDVALLSTTPNVISAYSGPAFARYMSGNIREQRRFHLREYTRVDRLQSVP